MNQHPVAQAIANIRAKTETTAFEHTYTVTINFHPDRFTPTGESLLSAIAAAGVLKSQFETGTSNGGLTAYEGGDRWLWEQRVFDGAYDNAPVTLRPKYGALNYQNYAFGASPRFGSAFFQLYPHVLDRTTFCYPDSYFEPRDFAINSGLNTLIDKANADDMDLLDNYIEAHIHGEVSLKHDVECIVLDPIYRNTWVEQHAQLLALPIRWHHGFVLSIKQMQQHPNYRGPEFIELAKQIAINGELNPRLLGNAVNEQGFDPQAVKKIWHYLGRFGG